MNAILPASFRSFAEAKGLAVASELVIDSFAGGGGASLGIERALQRLHALGLLGEGDPQGVNVAINHDAAAIAMHMANHPHALHLPHDIWRIDPLTATSRLPVGLLWASPDCRHHSKAKGGRPVSASVRDLAWVVAHWAEQVRPRMIFLENVEEFRQWGPLIPDGRGGLRPCPARKGKTFMRWIGKFKRLGYRVDWRELRSCEYGDPTIRKRLYIIMRCDGEPIVWPKPTHGDPKSEAVRSGKLLPWPVAADILDWSRPCPSIFMTRAEARAYTEATGLKLVRPLAFNTDARIARGVKRYVIDAAEPFIVTCNHAGEGFRGQGIGESFRTVAAARDAHGLVVPALAPVISHGQQGGRSRPADAPHHTIAASTKDTNQVIVPYMVPRYMERPGQEPRTRSVELPSATVVPGGNTGSLAAGFMVQHSAGSHPGRPGRPASEPVSTIVGQGTQQGVISAHLLSLKGSERRASSVEVAHPAIMAQGGHSAVVMPFLHAYYGSEETGISVEGPARTATTKDRFGLAQVEADVQPLTESQIAGAKRVADFLRAHGCWDGGDLVTVGPYVLVDIGMRMLTPRELARAQGFPDSYVLAAPFKGGVLSETDQRHKIGNSVCPGVAEALVFANFRPPKRPVPSPEGQGWLFAEAA